MNPLSIDHTLHSLFGKSSADLLVQEYGLYFGIKTACFQGRMLDGRWAFSCTIALISRLPVKCARSGQRYTVSGYKGKQVQDNIHSADLVEAFWQFFKSPRQDTVYNIGGGRNANCSVLEAIEFPQEICGKRLDWAYEPTNRTGDHIWWISDVRRFQNDYPQCFFRYDIRSILTEIIDGQKCRWKKAD